MKNKLLRRLEKALGNTYSDHSEYCGCRDAVHATLWEAEMPVTRAEIEYLIQCLEEIE